MDKPFALTQCQTMTLEMFHKMDRLRYAMEPKIDGWRIQMDVTPDGVHAWTRTQHDATGKIPEAERVLQHLALTTKETFRLDGEVVYLDENGNPDFNFTSRCMGSQRDTCIDKQAEQERWLSFIAFDVLQSNGYDWRQVPFEGRRVELERIMKADWYAIPIPISVPTIEQHQLNIDTFGEGSVLKDLNSNYAGKRHKSWLKWKAEETTDVVITGYKEGMGKFGGQIGAIVFRAVDGTTGNCSGMDDATRLEISLHREAYVGRTIEVKHYGQLVDGWRHPQFVRFRGDK